jgi:hypothetical protein
MLRRQFSSRSTLPDLPDWRPDGFDGGQTAAEASAAVRQSGSSAGAAEASLAVRQLRRGELGGSSAFQLPEYNPFLLHVAVHGLQRVKARVPFPQFFSTMAEISLRVFTCCESARDIRSSLYDT